MIIGACVAEAITVEPGLMRRWAGLKRAADYIVTARAGRRSGCAEAAVLRRSGPGGRDTGRSIGRCGWLGAVLRPHGTGGVAGYQREARQQQEGRAKD